jgi:hypothetical protein
VVRFTPSWLPPSSVIDGRDNRKRYQRHGQNTVNLTIRQPSVSPFVAETFLSSEKDWNGRMSGIGE